MPTEMLIEMGLIEVAATAIYVTVRGLDCRAIPPMSWSGGRCKD